MIAKIERWLWARALGSMFFGYIFKVGHDELTRAVIPKNLVTIMMKMFLEYRADDGSSKII